MTRLTERYMHWRRDMPTIGCGLFRDQPYFPGQYGRASVLRFVWAALLLVGVITASAIADDGAIFSDEVGVIGSENAGTYSEAEFTPIPVTAFEADRPLISLPDNPIQLAACCKVCRKGKACGNSCIHRGYTCRKPPGCACDGG